jgi:hypothetical protein
MKGIVIFLAGNADLKEVESLYSSNKNSLITELQKLELKYYNGTPLHVAESEWKAMIQAALRKENFDEIFTDFNTRDLLEDLGINGIVVLLGIK